MSEQTPKLLLSTAEAAQALGVSPRTLWIRTRDAQIPHVRMGRRVMYAPMDLRRWIREQKQTVPTTK